ncbi:MAG TPA: tRNA (adenosine(37)-N6)-threonylcarbamoyltransferase complex dimerization subunit type 1 TsaB [Vineibacter sp.]|nr:tRNA (adenosine(37)-N6)-threonylcarbamoyltransferase complex dimerization subunit type 1 TsaB [Vineibacter sp.]
MTSKPVLAFDCAAGACAVAVAIDAGASDVTVLARRVQAMQRGHATALAPMIEATLADARISARDVGLVATTVGPGSFTGVRIGLATARGLALALAVPLAGLTTIEALIAAAADRRPLHDRQRHLVAAVDTRRGDYYVGFEDAPTPRIADAAAIASRLEAGPVLIAGDGAASLCPLLARAGIDAIAANESDTVDPVVLARLALRNDVDQWRAANRRDGMPRPLYLRAAEAIAAAGRA